MRSSTLDQGISVVASRLLLAFQLVQLRTNHSKTSHSGRRLKTLDPTIRETKNHLLGSNSDDQKHVIGPG
jgi:hypothetical protein